MSNSITLGPIELHVQSAKELVTFYTQAVGLKILKQKNSITVLGDGEFEILRLVEQSGLTAYKSKSVGLYHSAILFPTQARLAKTILKIFQSYPALVEGSADHLATEAFYFHDPAGNGLELYFDKPRDQWPMDNGKPAMGSLFLDHNLYLDKYVDAEDNGVPLKLGHVHLKVSDIRKAKEFYVDVLKFDEIFNLPTALFVSYDNYHHHLGMNTWESAGSGNLNKNEAGLRSFVIKYNDESLYSDILKNLDSKKIRYQKNENGVTFEDPFGIKVSMIREV